MQMPVSWWFILQRWEWLYVRSLDESSTTENTHEGLIGQKVKDNQTHSWQWLLNLTFSKANPATADLVFDPPDSLLSVDEVHARCGLWFASQRQPTAHETGRWPREIILRLSSNSWSPRIRSHGHFGETFRGHSGTHSGSLKLQAYKLISRSSTTPINKVWLWWLRRSHTRHVEIRTGLPRQSQGTISHRSNRTMK